MKENGGTLRRRQAAEAKGNNHCITNSVHRYCFIHLNKDTDVCYSHLNNVRAQKNATPHHHLANKC